MRRFKVTSAATAVVIAGLLMCISITAQDSEEETSGSNVRVGTFDSRSLAMAYYRSEAFKRQMNEMRAELVKARAEGDQKRVKELEADGPARQELMHKQGFSIWPVTNILEMIEGDIPKIAAQAGVDVIISKWNIVYQRPGVEFVDVTDSMVKPFDPDAETLKIVKDIRTREPVPLKDIKNDHR